MPSFDVCRVVRLTLSVVNVFAGVLSNRLFCGILVVTSALQVLIVQFGSIAFHVADDGLSAKHWGISLLLGFGSLPVQQVINVVFYLTQTPNPPRNKSRLLKDKQMTKRNIQAM